MYTIYPPVYPLYHYGFIVTPEIELRMKKKRSKINLVIKLVYLQKKNCRFHNLKILEALTFSNDQNDRK